jgi:cholestenol Delta-isomerase
MAGATDVMGQAWKVYTLSDSRYLTQDDFLVCMETITAVFWGPLSLLCVHYIVTEHPLRHPLQIIISLGQFYGDVLYYATCTFEEVVKNVVYSRPEREIFWGLYVFMNAFWIVLPAYFIYTSVGEIYAAFTKLKKLESKVSKSD